MASKQKGRAIRFKKLERSQREEAQRQQATRSARYKRASDAFQAAQVERKPK